jgi:hypothetical protein
VPIIDHQKLIALHRPTRRIIHQIVKGVDDVLAIIKQFNSHDFSLPHRLSKDPPPLYPDLMLFAEINQTAKKPTRKGWLFCLQINDLLEFDVERAMGNKPFPVSSRK